MAYDTASNYSVMLFFLENCFPPCVGCMVFAQYWAVIIASSSLYNIFPQYVLMAYSCPWVLSEVEIHFIPSYGWWPAQQWREDLGWFCQPTRSFYGPGWKGDEGRARVMLPQDPAQETSSFLNSNKFHLLWFGRKLRNHDPRATHHVRN